MRTWRGQTEDGTFAVEIHASLLLDLDRYCHDAGSIETGGILIGRYSEDLALAIVREATLPPKDSKRGRSWFVRGVNGLREMLWKRWAAEERTFYIGEWHFHPANYVEPSGEDFSQMIQISRAREYDCKEPLLLIFGAGKHEGDRAFRVFVSPAARAPMEFHRMGSDQ
jgi:hypothetical protein